MSVTEIKPTTNGAAPLIELEEPYNVTFRINGTAALLLHAWNNEAVKEKANAKKNSTAKKTDNLESYVYRCDDGTIGVPGYYVHGAIREAARFRQDPRSPRKSAMDLYKAAIAPLTQVASLGATDWEYIDRRRAVVQRNAITRERPAFLPGWELAFDFVVTLPEYVQPDALLDVLVLAGRVIGIGDHRPTYGRFQVTAFEVITLD